MGRNAKLRQERKHRQKMSTWCERRQGKTQLGNFGVFCGQTGFLVDSASTPEEADRFCEYINQRLKKHPLIDPSDERWFEWVCKHQEWSPDANMMTTDVDGGDDLALWSEVMKKVSDPKKEHWTPEYPDGIASDILDDFVKANSTHEEAMEAVDDPLVFGVLSIAGKDLRKRGGRELMNETLRSLPTYLITPVFKVWIESGDFE